MDVAVAPDTGFVYAVTSYLSTVGVPADACQTSGTCATGNQIVLLRSRDKGETWDPPTVIGASREKSYIYPRVAAGPNGLVLVGAHLEDGRRLVDSSLAVSTDAGVLFGPWQSISSQHGTLDPLWWSDGSQTGVIGLVAGGRNEIMLYESQDLGKTWEAREIWRAAKGSPGSFWTSAAAWNGTVATLIRTGSEAHMGFSAELVRVDAAGNLSHLTLASADSVDGQWVPGDDYGGAAIATDGTVYASWADPRPLGPYAKRIALARVPV